MEELKNYADSFVDDQRVQHGRQLEKKQNELREALEEVAYLKEAARAQHDNHQAAERISLELRARVASLQDQLTAKGTSTTQYAERIRTLRA